MSHAQVPGYSSIQTGGQNIVAVEAYEAVPVDLLISARSDPLARQENLLHKLVIFGLIPHLRFSHPNRIEYLFTAAQIVSRRQEGWISYAPIWLPCQVVTICRTAVLRKRSVGTYTARIAR